MSTKRAAVALIERDDHRVLCVWNRRYAGWSLPGGLVEDGETIEAGLARELREETSLKAVGWAPIFDGPHKTPLLAGRGSHVHVFVVSARGTPREMEPSCPVTWLTREEFLQWSPFAAFYQDVFRAWPVGAIGSGWRPE